MDLSPDQAIRPGTVYFGDCLGVMEKWRAEQVDLIYLDPPFNSKKNYNILFGTGTGERASQFLAFEDTWQWDGQAEQRTSGIRNAVAHPAHKAIAGLYEILGDSGMMAYLSYMAERLCQAHRMLKPTGSIYLHCDPEASHYLKLLMDDIFGKRNFRNEIVWCYRGGGVPKDAFARKHDVILRYGKGRSVKFHKQYVAYSKASRELIQKRGGTSIDNRPRDLDRGAAMPDWWTDINSLQTWSPERLGYPTQKPLGLLERIIRASTDEDDLVLDPFCGCGTSLVAAYRLGRRWAGIDISPFAVERVIRPRFSMLKVTITADGIPSDMSAARLLANSDRFKFEAWAVNQIPGMAPNSRQVADRGVDGRGTLLNKITDTDDKLVLAQVKSGNYSASDVRAFRRVVTNPKNRAVAGVFITLERNWSANMEREFEDCGSFRVEGAAEEHPRLQFWSIEDLFGEVRPRLPSLADPFTGRDMNPGLWAQ